MPAPEERDDQRLRGVPINVLGKIAKCATLRELADVWDDLEAAGQVGTFGIHNMEAGAPRDGSSGFCFIITSGNVVPRGEGP